MKGTFCFVNTRDAEGAKQAREVLNGALLGQSPVRINMAQRKNRDAPNSSFRNNNSAYGNGGGSNMNNMGGIGMGMQGRSNPPGMPPMQGQAPDASGENVRDDRGNPATKNLFVAGYGPGTTEQEVRDLFGQHCTIIGIIMKGTFSFVNTSIKLQAIQTREALSGTMMNGGVLRINFAKETGRLGTSFDLTYRGSAAGGGPGGGPGGGGPGGGGGGDSRYGRGGY
jgi:RNA recognition motif-containing protein